MRVGGGCCGTVTDAYVKVNLPPYLLHVDLFQDVDHVRSAAVVEGNVVTFRLVKVLTPARTLLCEVVVVAVKAGGFSACMVLLPSTE